MSRLMTAAITDEFSPTDLDRALDAMQALGMSGAELRIIGGRNVLTLPDEAIDRARAAVEARGMRVVSIASPVFKCELPDAPPVDGRLGQDTFLSTHTLADQPALAARAFDIAERTGAPIVRVFSFWRTIDPSSCFDRIVHALRDLAEQAARRKLIVGIENEHACHIATGREAADLLEAADHPALGLIWDPANALVAGERAFPDGYAHLPVHRIVHVHAKDCRARDFVPTWGPLGDMDVNWRAQIAALVRDGYRGAISLETHWTGPQGDKFEASRICGQRLRQMIEATPVA
jgi:sugar phosphate isomerase/epimerase